MFRCGHCYTFSLECIFFNGSLKCFSSTGANVHATTATGDTALTYACENGHTDVADVLLQAGADLVSIFPFQYVTRSSNIV